MSFAEHASGWFASRAAVPTPSPPKRRRLCRRTSASSAVSVASVVAVSPPRRTLAREHSAADIASDEHDVVRVSPTKKKSDTFRSALGLYTETRAATVSTLFPSPDAEYVDSSTLLATRLWKDGTMTTCSLQAGAKGFATYDFGDGVKESEVPNMVVTARDTEVRRRPAACVIASRHVRSAQRANRTDRDRRGGQDRSAALLETRTTTDRIEEVHVDVVQKSPQSCGATVVWRQATSGSGSAGSHPSVFAETSRTSRLTVDRRRTRRDRRCMAKGTMFAFCPLLRTTLALLWHHCFLFVAL